MAKLGISNESQGYLLDTSFNHEGWDMSGENDDSYFGYIHGNLQGYGQHFYQLEIRRPLNTSDVGQDVQFQEEVPVRFSVSVINGLNEDQHAVSWTYELTLTKNPKRQSVLNHYYMYFGLSSLIIFTIAIVLIKLDLFTAKLHGILMTIAFILTLVNVIFIWNSIWVVLTHKPATTRGWFHYFHILAGFMGMGAFIIAYIKGLAGYKNKKSGYLAYALWLYNFISGGLLWGYRL